MKWIFKRTDKAQSIFTNFETQGKNLKKFTQVFSSSERTIFILATRTLAHLLIVFAH